MNYIKYYASILYDKSIKYKEHITGIYTEKQISKKYITKIIAFDPDTYQEINIVSKNVFECMEEFINFNKNSTQESIDTGNKICERLNINLHEIIRNEIISKSLNANYDNIILYIVYIFHNIQYLVCINNIVDIRYRSNKFYAEVIDAKLITHWHKKQIDITDIIKKYQGPYNDFHSDFSRTNFYNIINTPYSVYQDFGYNNIGDNDIIRITFINNTIHEYNIDESINSAYNKRLF